MSPLLPRPAPGRRADYVHFLPLTLRWADNDVFGHVNNAHYYHLFDATVCQFLVTRGVLRPGAELHTVMAESGCRYHSEIAFPQLIVGGLRVARLGTSSVRFEIALFREDADAASAEGFMVHVCVAAATRRPAPMPDAWRATLQKLIRE
jgi:acyl-CoA thioester hydrolase